jgi:hypothetical protein
VSTCKVYGQACFLVYKTSFSLDTDSFVLPPVGRIAPDYNRVYVLCCNGMRTATRENWAKFTTETLSRDLCTRVSATDYLRYDHFQTPSSSSAQLMSSTLPRSRSIRGNTTTWKSARRARAGEDMEAETGGTQLGHSATKRRRQNSLTQVSQAENTYLLTRTRR